MAHDYRDILYCCHSYCDEWRNLLNPIQMNSPVTKRIVLGYFCVHRLGVAGSRDFCCSIGSPHSMCSNRISVNFVTMHLCLMALFVTAVVVVAPKKYQKIINNENNESGMAQSAKIDLTSTITGCLFKSALAAFCAHVRRAGGCGGAFSCK